MKKILVVIIIGLCFTVLPTQQAKAVIPIVQIIKAAIKKVIRAIDLQVQRLQNKTIWLQNTQKTLENKMSKLKLDEIREWVEKQRKLYDDYFQELRKVKATLANYQRVKEIIQRQVQIVNEYQAAWALFRQDKNFSREEIIYIYEIYTGMLNESLKSIDQLFLVVKSFAATMNDAGRLEIINTVSGNLEQQMTDLKKFNNQNKMISLQRASEKGEIEYAKRLHGLVP